METLTVDFGPLDISYDGRVLEPRAWTVEQATWATRLLVTTAPAGPVLELCGGAGHIGLLAVRGTGRRLVVVDRDPVACEWARVNARANAPGADVEVRCAAVDEAVLAGERFALVVADPPWVRSADVGTFPDDPRGAIDGGEQGLDVARLCLATAARALLPGGSLVLQLGDAGQAEALGPAAEDAGLAPAGLRTFPRGTLARFDRA